jgi:FkbM family methyltransferase
MLLDFDHLVSKYEMKIKGVLHIGAHYGQEHNLYKRHGIENISYFEPLVSNFEKLNENINDGSSLYRVALGNENKKVSMFVETANQGMSSSILEPKIHLSQYPHIKFELTEEVDMKRLDDMGINENDYNMIVIDVQGYEMEVFKGSTNFLNKIDYIFSEINRDEVYENCTKVDELSDFLSTYNFELKEHNWVGGSWGEALYIKKNN